MDQSRPTPRSLRARLTRVGIVAASLGALSALAFPTYLFWNNFAVVDPGRAYRSAQPKGDGLRRIVAEHGVASVLNLRGGSIADPWYRDEVAAARALDVDYYDFPMSATSRPSRCELLTLLDLLDHCRYPILIHCKSGSDRTGLVSGLYLLSRRGVSPDEALGAFSIFRGHVPLGGPQRLQQPLREYRAWLTERGLDHAPDRFRSWVERDYRDDRPVGPCAPLRPGPRAVVAAGTRSEPRR